MDWITIIVALVTGTLAAVVTPWSAFGVALVNNRLRTRQRDAQIKAAIDSLSPKAIEFLQRFLTEGNPIHFMRIPAAEWGKYIQPLAKAKVLILPRYESDEAFVGVAMHPVAIAYMRAKHPVPEPEAPEAK